MQEFGLSKEIITKIIDIIKKYPEVESVRI